MNHQTIPFNISATRQGAKAMIRITGEIGWETDAETFRKEVDKLVADGIRDAHLYINTPGGSVFDANEIVNIISSFKGRITGEGGALVASAGTYIAVHCHSFSMPSNGQFMIHKPSGITTGKVSEIENYLKMMRSMEKLYFDAYLAKAVDKADFKSKWEAGDYWMNASEAKQAGFITDVKAVVNVDPETIAMFAVCNCPNVPVAATRTETAKRSDEIGFKQSVAAILGLQDNISDTDVIRHIIDLKKEVNDVKTTLLQDAYNANRISATEMKTYMKLPVSSIHNLLLGYSVNRHWTFNQWQTHDPAGLGELRKNDPERYKTLVDAYVKEQRAGQNFGSAGSPEPETSHEWTFKDWSKRNPNGLAEMRRNEPQRYQALFDAEYKR